jgi:putative phosphoesterase
LRLALISDLHANIVALDAVLDDMASRGVDKLMCLGDIVDMGPRPNEVVARLREHDVESIIGNHDPLDEATPILVLEKVRDWTAAELTAEHLAWLAGLPSHTTLDLGGCRLLAVHGSPSGVSDNIAEETTDEQLEAWCAGHEFDVLVCGHTHVQHRRQLGSRHIVNVGSVGQPFADVFRGQLPPSVLPRCDYAIVEGRDGVYVGSELIQLPLDVDAMLASYEGTSFPDREAWASSWR